ncbi:hypothetical protein RRG08_044063 [Elysia crispata]|uniref:Uncharacterized protein n=1 Tax=Elysia crispata TaxID=231223 RepID=A0AAE1CR57_9GAST|nr:hypothetical protein RRG08_044063 [Elysia crispata]
MFDSVWETRAPQCTIHLTDFTWQPPMQWSNRPSESRHLPGFDPTFLPQPSDSRHLPGFDPTFLPNLQNLDICPVLTRLFSPAFRIPTSAQPSESRHLPGFDPTFLPSLQNPDICPVLNRLFSPAFRISTSARQGVVKTKDSALEIRDSSCIPELVHPLAPAELGCWPPLTLRPGAEKSVKLHL